MDNNLAQGTIEMYNSLAEDMAEYYKLDYRDARSPHARLHAALRATGRRLGRHVAALEARVMGGEFETFRIAGDDCIDYFLQCWRLDDALRLGPPWVDPNNYWWFRRSLLATRARLHRAISAYQVRYTLELSEVDTMIALGELYQLVHKHSGMAVTYSDVYLTKGNPYMLQRLAPHIGIAAPDGSRSTRIFGVAGLAGEQGGERLNASHKSTYPLLTNGLPGSELKYLEALYIARAACASGDYPDARPPPIIKHQRQRWPDEDDDDGGGGGGGPSKSSLAARRREAKKRGETPGVATFTCACGRPADSTFAALQRSVPQAESLRLELGNSACRTCHDCSQLVCELGVDTPTGQSARVIKLKEFVRVKEAAQADFDAHAERARKHAQMEAAARKAAEAEQVSAADMLDLGQEDDGPHEAEGDADPDTSDDEGERPARGLAFF